MNSCPVCGHHSELRLAYRPHIPLLQNRVWPDVQSAASAPAGQLSMMFCNTCHFAWNAAFDADKDIYDDAYDNDQMQSGHFREHANAMMRRIVDSLPQGRPVHLVEVGCGQGIFLTDLMNVAGDRLASATGFDPALKAERSSDRIDLKKDYFNERTSGRLQGPAEIVVSRHTIEHTPDPLSFLKTIRASMAVSPSSRLLLETPDIQWIVDNLQDQDLFYEHCSIFSRDGLEIALRLAGFDQIKVDRVFGGQYLWAEASPQAGAAPTVQPHLADYGREVARFAAHSSSFAADWRKTIVESAATGDVWLWGAASKGVTFALLVDPDGALLAGAIDINEKKAGQFMPLTGLPIRSPDALPDGATVIVMNENYLEEIRSQIARMGKQARLLALS